MWLRCLCPKAPATSPNHPIGRSDGRCVQRAGTYSTRAVDTHLQGIPGSRRWLQPSIPTTWRFTDSHKLSHMLPSASHIVARVQPRASKGHHGPVIATLLRLLNEGSPFIKAVVSLVSWINAWQVNPRTTNGHAPPQTISCMPFRQAVTIDIWSW